MNSSPKAILVDMDDTIVAFEHGVDLAHCWHDVCRRHLPGIDEGGIDRVVGRIREQARWHWSDPERHRIGRLDLNQARTEIVAAALKDLHPVQQDDIPRSIAVEYGRIRNEAMYLFPGALDTLTQLRERGIKLALITNGEAKGQREKVVRFALEPYFDLVLIEEEFGAGKPDPAVYLHALEQLGAAPEEAWMVGDNFEWEIVAPQKLGIRGIWIRHGRQVPEGAASRPYRVVDALSDLLE